MTDFTIRVRATGGADIQAIQRALSGLGATVTRTNSNLSGANNAAAGFNRTMNQGVIGTANSTRSFSKLAETIGGSNGLVGAYATLAANAFAVSAAFNALRSAAQVQQVLEGLNASGARTGLTLSVAAKQVQTLSGNLLSAEQSMRSTAQVMSAGFSTDKLKEITKVAKDASFALGRPMQDSMDRLTRGIVKLEPELLDELGIMTKLTESNTNMALSLGKSATALTSFEKRQGFANAVLAEGQLKFGDLSKAAGNTTNYDKLAATFSDLSKTVLNGFNDSLGLKAFAGFLASNPTALTASLLLFASTIRKQLLPGLSQLAERTRAASQVAQENIRIQYQGVRADNARAASQRALAVTQAQAAVNVVPQGPRAFNSIVPSMRAGTATIVEQNRAIAALDRSMATHRRQIDAGNISDATQIARKEALILVLNQQKIAIENLAAAQATATSSTAAATAADLRARNAYQVSRIQATAQTGASNAVNLASQGISNFPAAANAGGRAISMYAASVFRASGVMATSAAAFRTAGFAIITTTRLIGAGLLTAMPYVALAFAAWSILAPMFQTKLTPAQEEYNSQLEQYNEIISKVQDKVTAYNRIQLSSASASAKAFQQLTIQTNAIMEITNAYSALAAQKKLADASTADVESLEDRSRPRQGFFSTRSSRKLSPEQLRLMDLADKGLGDNAATGLFSKLVKGKDDKDGRALLDQLDALQKFDPQNFKRITDELGGSKIATLGYSDALAVAGVATKRFGENASRLSGVLEDAKSSFAQAEKAAAEFIVASIPSTPFDGIANASSELVITTQKLELEFRRGTISGQQFASMLSGIGSSYQSLMNVDASKAIQEFASLEAKVVQMRNVIASDPKQNNARNQQNLRQLEQERLVLARSTNIVVQKSVQETAKTTIELQRQTRVLDGQLRLEQAKLSTISNLYTLNGKGMLEGFKNEERARGLLVEKIRLEMKLHENIIAQNKTRMEGLRIAQKEILGTTYRDMVDERNLKLRGALATNDTAFIKQVLAEGTHEVLLDRAKREAQIRSQELGIEIQQLENAGAAERAAFDNLKNQSAAIMAENLTETQKLSRASEKDYELSQKYVSMLKDQASALSNIFNIQDKIRILASGRKDDIRSQIELTRKSAQLEKARLASEYRNTVQGLEQRKATIAADVARAKSQGNSDGGGSLELQNINREIEGLGTILRLRGAEIDNAQQLSELEATLFDTRKEGLQWQIDSLSYLEKQVTVSKQLAEIQFNNVQSRAEILRNNTRIKTTEDFGRKQEIESAVFAYEQAQKGYNLRVAGIDLEFTLLEAQRTALVEELRARKSILMETTSLSESDLPIRQLTASIDNLNRSRGAIEDVRLASRNIATQEIEGLRLQVQKVIQNSQSRDDSGMGISGQFRDFNNLLKAQTEAVSRTRVAANDNARVSSVSGVSDNNYLPFIKLKEIAERDQKPIPVMVSLATRVAVGMEELVRLSGGSNAREAVVTVGKMLQDRGFKVWQHENFGGVTRKHEGAGHREGRAIDVYSRAGKGESTDPAEKARYDALERELTAMGARVLWQVKGHFDHMHVEFKEGFTRIAEASKAIATATVSEIGKTSKISTDYPSRTGIEGIEAAKIALDTEPAIAGLEHIFEILANLPTEVDKFNRRFSILNADLMKSFEALGPQGAVVVSVTTGMQTIATRTETAFKAFKDSKSNIASLMKDEGMSQAAASAVDFADRATAAASVASSAISTVSSALASGAEAKINAIDAEIAAEQRRDGKSAESVAKLAALEKKKDEIARKQFNTNKKLMMAQAVIATAAGIAQALTLGPIAGPIMAGVIGALGLAQIAIIAGTQYQSTNNGSAANAASAPSTLTIGKRGDTVDLARQNNNVGGELGYLRGRTGVGSNASNYNVIGSAYGGDLPRGYGNTAYVVGEKGPETIVPTSSFSVRPANDNVQSSPVSANITINALDSRGIEDVLQDQRGNIISMLRDAANTNGSPFMEDVNVSVYSRPNRTAGSKM